MKKILCLLCSLILSGCASVNMREVLTVYETHDDKLPTMEAVYVDAVSSVPQYWDSGSKVVQSGSTRATLFYQQVEKNLTDPYGDMHGYIEMRDNTFLDGPDPIRVGDVWGAMSVVTLGTLNLLGMPAYHFKPYSEINVRVLDKSGKLVKRYQAIVEDSEYAALYWGYSLGAGDDLLLRTYRKALDKVIDEMKNDYDYLYNKLK